MNLADAGFGAVPVSLSAATAGKPLSLYICLHG